MQIFTRLVTLYRLCSRWPCWRSQTINHICIRIKFISQRKIILLFHSSNMAAVNILYIDSIPVKLEKLETKKKLNHNIYNSTVHIGCNSVTAKPCPIIIIGHINYLYRTLISVLSVWEVMQKIAAHDIAENNDWGEGLLFLLYSCPCILCS